MRILSGVQPSGKLHIGNYFGAIRQFIELQHHEECLFFIADYHALTTLRDAQALRNAVLDVAIDYVALGLDPNKVTLFRQSEIPEVSELFWYLSAITPMGLLERAHAYKDKIARGFAPDLGLFSYPVLMAADILLYDAEVVPVGKDQVQHIEMTRDIAIKFNALFDHSSSTHSTQTTMQPLLRLPRALVQDKTAVVPGLDGQKMSKSYNNTIDLFADDSVVQKKIMSIKTDSTPVEAPKDLNGSPIFPLLQLFASTNELVEIEQSYRDGGKGYGHYKKRLLELFHEHFDAARIRRKQLAQDVRFIEDILHTGAKRARLYAKPVIERIRSAVGTRH